MTAYELKRKLSELQDEAEWAANNEVKLDLGGLVVDIADIVFDTARGEFFIVAPRR